MSAVIQTDSPSCGYPPHPLWSSSLLIRPVPHQEAGKYGRQTEAHGSQEELSKDGHPCPVYFLNISRIQNGQVYPTHQEVEMAGA